MVKVKLIDRDGAEWTPKAISKLVIEVDENVPADSLYAEFPYMACPEPVGVRVFSDDAEVFRGVIDEEEHAADGGEAQEFISATVRVENVYGTEGGSGEENGTAILGQSLIFTFSPYTIEKNQHTYDASGQPRSTLGSKACSRAIPATVCSRISARRAIPLCRASAVPERSASRGS